jgi:uncharacterized protein YeaO (DUF488 family)
MKNNIKIKRVYDAPSKDDGARILVDHLWPRGKSKKGLKIKEWMKDIAPSLELIKWFSHDPEKWLEFKKRYQKELKSKKDLIKSLKEIAEKQQLTLLYAAKDTEHNNAVVLQDLLRR